MTFYRSYKLTTGKKGCKTVDYNKPPDYSLFPMSAVYAFACTAESKMISNYFCDSYEPCPALGYCLLSSTRLGYELASLRKSLTVQQPLCEFSTAYEVATAIERFSPKAVADADRVELVYDFYAVSPEIPIRPRTPFELLYGRGVQTHRRTSGHYLYSEQLFRDAPFVPRLRLRSLGSSTRGVVTAANPVTDMAELGSRFNLPEGFEMWASDIIRIERFDSEGIPVDDTLILELYLLGSGSFADSYRALRRTADGELVDMEEAGVTVEPSLLHHEPGWVLMTIPKGIPLMGLGTPTR